MPTYTFRNVSTGEEYTDMMPISLMEELISDGEFIVVPASFGIAYDDRKKPHGDFRSRLADIKKSHYGSVINVP